jgi:hypothetical protein
MSDTSPADLLRRAATLMRERETEPWIRAVANLLDFAAATSRLLDALSDTGSRPTHHYALAVARAYLGVEVTS